MTTLTLPWADVKSFADSRGLTVQWIVANGVYFVYVFDGPFVVSCEVPKEMSPGADQTEFEATYKAKGNRIIQPRSSAGMPLTEPSIFTGPSATRSVSLVSHDLSDRTTWYQKSVQVVDEVLTDSGDGLTFTSINTDWINIDNARLTYTHKQILKRDGSFGKHADWRTVVKVDDVVQTTGYTQNFATGAITFGASKAGSTIKCTYWHNNGVSNPSEWLLAPPSGKKMLVQHVELQFSVDIVINNTVRFEIWAGASLGTYGTFASALWEAGYGQFRADYRNARDLINAANQGQGTIPAIGELTQDVVVMPFNYVQALTLDSAVGTLFRMVLLDNLPFTGGEMCTATFYLQIV